METVVLFGRLDESRLFFCSRETRVSRRLFSKKLPLVNIKNKLKQQQQKIRQI